MSSGSGGQDDPLTLTPTSSRNPQGSTRPLGLSLTPQQHRQLSSPGITVSGTPSPIRLFRPANSTMMVRAPGDVNQQQHRLIPLPSGTRIFRPATSTQTPMRTPLAYVYQELMMLVFSWTIYLSIYLSIYPSIYPSTYYNYPAGTLTGGTATLG